MSNWYDGNKRDSVTFDSFFYWLPSNFVFGNLDLLVSKEKRIKKIERTIAKFSSTNPWFLKEPNKIHVTN